MNATRRVVPNYRRTYTRILPRLRILTPIWAIYQWHNTTNSTAGLIFIKRLLHYKYNVVLVIFNYTKVGVKSPKL